VAKVAKEETRKDLTDLYGCGYDEFGLNSDLLEQFKVEEVGSMLQRFKDLN
jgi:hypothetical protein